MSARVAMLGSRASMKPLALLWIVFGLSPAVAHAADSMRLDDVVAHARHALEGPRVGFEDGPLMELVQRAMVSATGAEVALATPLPPGIRLGPGPIAVRDLLHLAPTDLRIATLTLSGEQIRELLERSAGRFASYSHEDDRPLLVEGAADSLIDSFQGLSYEIDLSRPVGDRVIHLTRLGHPLDPGEHLVVAVDERRLTRGDLPPADDFKTAVWLKDALIDFAASHPDLGPLWDHDWWILPDYAATPERALIDRLVRHRALPREEVLRLFPAEPARRGDMAYWLARVYGWRETRLSGAFADVPDSLEPWLDGLLRRGVLGGASTAELFQPFAPIQLTQALDWCEGAARRGGLGLEGVEQVRAFRRALLTGTALGAKGEGITADTLTRSQMLGMIANLRLPALRIIQATAPQGREREDARTPAELAGEVGRLRDQNPEGTLWFSGRDTTVALRGLHVAVQGRGPTATESSQTIEIRIGRTRAPLQAIAAGEIGVSDLVVDPVLQRVVENRERRVPIGALAPAPPSAQGR